MITMEQKKCKQCRETKAETEFQPKRLVCRMCVNQSNKLAQRAKYRKYRKKCKDDGDTIERHRWLTCWFDPESVERWQSGEDSD